MVKKIWHDIEKKLNMTKVQFLFLWGNLHVQDVNDFEDDDGEEDEELSEHEEYEFLQ